MEFPVFFPCSGLLIFYSTDIQKSSQSFLLLSQYIIFWRQHYIFFKNHRRVREVFYGDIFNFGSATAPAYVQPEKLFTFLSSFSPHTFSSFNYLSDFSASSYIQLYVQLEKLFNCQPVHLFKLFQLSYFLAFLLKYLSLCLFSFFKNSASCSAGETKMFNLFSPFSLLLFSLSAFSAFEKFCFFYKFLTIRPCLWIQTSVFTVCRVTQCTPLTICSLCRLQGVLLTLAYI